jgi:DNA-binding PadR family transcriptional regulator
MPSSLGDLEQLVLLAVLRLGPEAFGIAVQQEIVTRTRREVSLGAIYTTLARLEQKGFVSTTLGEPTPVRGGRRKKFYRVLAPGRRALAASLADLRAMARGLATSFELR